MQNCIFPQYSDVVSSSRGDQIFLLTYWAIVNSRQLLENYTSSTNCWATFFQMYYLCIDFDKKWSGLHCVPFFRKLIRSPWLQSSFPRNAINLCEHCFSPFFTIKKPFYVLIKLRTHLLELEEENQYFETVH
jgi:hypothetical protein